MTIRFQCRQDKNMPKLGWIAVVDKAENSLKVLHGEYVEHGADWLVEGAWDGRFRDGAFHRSECFYGSGIKKEGKKIFFVPSIANTDHILLCRDGKRIIASNSLLLLLAFTGASLDEKHDYWDETTSIALKGLKHYKKEFKIIHPHIRYFYQIFQENIIIENGEISYEPKPSDGLDFDSYEDYYRSLVEKLEKIKDNFSSSDRYRPLKAFATLSTGYDSTAVSCLAKKIGVEECFSGRPLDGLIFKQPAEQSERISRKLYFNIHRMDSRRKSITRDELYFLAGNYPKHSRSVWSEISLHPMAKAIQKRQSPAVVFMGYCGDEVWGDDGSVDPKTGDLLHTLPISGSNLAEIRLHTGFLTISPAHMFLQNISQIKKISDSKEMDPWRLNNDYDRPIARRIAEEAGIPREWFGMQKRHITTTYFWPINIDNRLTFFRYLKDNMHLSKRSVATYYLKKRLNINIFGQKPGYANGVDFYDIMKKWATEVLRNEYAAALKKQIGLLYQTSM